MNRRTVLRCMSLDLTTMQWILLSIGLALLGRSLWDLRHGESSLLLFPCALGIRKWRKSDHPTAFWLSVMGGLVLGVVAISFALVP